MIEKKLALNLHWSIHQSVNPSIRQSLNPVTVLWNGEKPQTFRSRSALQVRLVTGH
jgi:hypothetical protein